MTADPSKLEEVFASFLAVNPYSKIAQIVTDGHTSEVIERPWNDESIALGIPKDDPAKLAEALNALILPQRFSALWHKDIKALEIIWTAFKPSNHSLDIIDRKFTFTLGNNDYLCEFGDGSERLLVVAEASFPTRGTDTGYRNLSSIWAYQHRDAQDDQIKARLGKPCSFWIRNVDWNEDHIVDLAYHFNFYMSYFDDRTTKIIIHPTAEVSEVKQQHRYIKGKFPSQIRAKTIDPNILHFWSAAHGADDQAKSFLYYYRLIEYASTSYVDRESRRTVQRLLARPDALDDLATLTEQLMLALQLSKTQEEQKIVWLLQDTIDPAVIWREIENNIASFTRKTEFEGGFTLDPLVSGTPRVENFELAKFSKHTKDIRNALSHGRDIRTQMVIIPTRKNFALLQPWVTLMCVAAGEVVLHKSVG